ncbi:DUF805 domain-containing protein [Paenibacillus montanisoli]|uniref:DUF805 domain-containing protein n=1 Tax=Paenibacillus montanisoli TaxID=2081970 RepID=A0A328TWQ5_9BACL|nr:DUF805 domain-containing protein [Paenibacillus montanisoli]RAP74928.1 DUF805 domain-containing protein [Paenibacillus montanisoli]
MEWYLKVLNNYVVFEGRARRKEYWMFVLFNVIISLVLSGLARMLGMSWISSIYSLAVLLPGLAVAVRRLHDTNRSGWWLLINFVPLIGFIIFIVFMCLEGDPGDNQYGPNPKAFAP